LRLVHFNPLQPGVLPGVSIASALYVVPILVEVTALALRVQVERLERTLLLAAPGPTALLGSLDGGDAQQLRVADVCTESEWE
jgi:hypothetical protein